MNFDMSNQTNSGLLRFRSARRSLFSNFETGSDYSNLISQNYEDLEEEEEDKSCLADSSNGGYSLNSPSNSHSHSHHQLPPHYQIRQSLNSASAAAAAAAMENSYRVVSSMGMDNPTQPKMGSSLLRQNSSPAGLFTHLTPPQSGYAAIRGTGNYRIGNVANRDLSPSLSRLKGQMNSFSSGVPSSLGMLSRISEIEAETVEASGPNDAKVRNGNGSTLYASDYPLGPWENDSSHFVENFTGLKRELDDVDDGKLFAGAQNGDRGNHLPMLSHHLSLPKTSVGMAAVEKLLHFEDSVPCKIRAKRGCATHPRSIAERVRRTRISERMRKLQEFVPNMDKTNTADMLDLAVDYIKDLQKQYKTLSDCQANCRCASMQKLVLN